MAELGIEPFCFQLPNAVGRCKFGGAPRRGEGDGLQHPEVKRWDPSRAPRRALAKQQSPAGQAPGGPAPRWPLLSGRSRSSRRAQQAPPPPRPAPASLLPQAPRRPSLLGAFGPGVWRCRSHARPGSAATATATAGSSSPSTGEGWGCRGCGALAARPASPGPGGRVDWDARVAARLPRGPGAKGRGTAPPRRPGRRGTRWERLSNLPPGAQPPASRSRRRGRAWCELRAPGGAETG